MPDSDENQASSWTIVNLCEEHGEALTTGKPRRWSKDDRWYQIRPVSVGAKDIVPMRGPQGHPERRVPNWSRTVYKEIAATTPTHRWRNDPSRRFGSD